MQGVRLRFGMERRDVTPETGDGTAEVRMSGQIIDLPDVLKRVQAIIRNFSCVGVIKHAKHPTIMLGKFLDSFHRAQA